jgi:hypothetical protein
MRKVIGLTCAALLLVALTARVHSVQAVGGSATLTVAGSTQGPAGGQVSYKYSSVYQTCASEAADPKTLQVQLLWDQPAQVIGTSPLTIIKAAFECDGQVSGTIPQGASPGDHIVSAVLVDSAKGGAQVPGTTVSAPTPFTIPGAAAAAGGGGGSTAAPVAASGDTAVPFSWIGIGALAMLDVLLAAALLFVLSRSRSGARPRP